MKDYEYKKNEGVKIKSTNWIFKLDTTTELSSNEINRHVINQQIPKDGSEAANSRMLSQRERRHQSLNGYTKLAITLWIA